MTPDHNLLENNDFIDNISGVVANTHLNPYRIRGENDDWGC
jgi:hypothetical protein